MHADVNAAINIRDNYIRMDGVPQVNRKRSLWAKRSRPSLPLVLKVVDINIHASVHLFITCNRI